MCFAALSALPSPFACRLSEQSIIWYRWSQKPVVFESMPTGRSCRHRRYSCSELNFRQAHVLLAFSRPCNTKGGAEVESVSMHANKHGWMQTLPVHPLAGRWAFFDSSAATVRLSALVIHRAEVARNFILFGRQAEQEVEGTASVRTREKASVRQPAQSPTGTRKVRVRQTLILFLLATPDPLCPSANSFSGKRGRNRRELLQGP